MTPSERTCCESGPNGCPTCRPTLWRPAIRCVFRLASGEVIDRWWSMFDAKSPSDFADIPDWLDNPLKAWPHPQDPVTFSGDVQPGHEADALAFVAGGHSDES